VVLEPVDYELHCCGGDERHRGEHAAVLEEVIADGDHRVDEAPLYVWFMHANDQVHEKDYFKVLVLYALV